MATTKITSPDLFDLGSLNTALKLPSGTTAQRPTSPSTGEWRYNTTTNLVEFWDGGAWRDLQSENIPPINSENFNTVIWTGDGTASRAITGVGFKPDWVWYKTRSAANDHNASDSTRGAQFQIRPDRDIAQVNATDQILSFDTDGFTIGSGGDANANGATYVAWCWKANGGTTSSNTDGSITTTVQANTKAAFSIMQYTGTGANATVGHGLSSAPELVIVKKTSDVQNWMVGATVVGWTKYMELNLSNAAATASSTWNNTAPTTTTVSLGSSNNGNQSGQTYIMYAFSSVAGYSSFGSYTGNGSATGPLVNTGFEPAFLIVKRTDSSANWRLLDNKRSTSNPRQKTLFPNLNNAESDVSADAVDFLTNGFQIKNNDSSWNANGGTYLYIAFASDASAAPSLAESFNISLWTGNGSSQSISGLGFSPSLVWGKERSNTSGHEWLDTIRGATNYISSSSTGSQATSAQGLQSFDADGFTVGNDGAWNQAGETYVAWNWKANSIPTINTDGTIQSIVSANQAAGFSIVSYTGDGTSGSTVGHNLGTTPEVVIYKRLDATASWIFKSTLLNTDDYLALNLTDQVFSDSGVFWNGTAPTSTVFTLGNSASVNTSSANYIAYCFTSISGFSKIGSYNGSGSDGNVVATGFKPSWVMIKRSNSTSGWLIFDSARSPSNPVNDRLEANNNSAEQTGSTSKFVDFNATDFEANGSDSELNASGGTYIYMAFKQTQYPQAGTMTFLTIAGGGGGGASSAQPGSAAGGGAGGLRTSYKPTSGGGSGSESDITLAAGTYTITVGSGGGGASYTGAFYRDGNDGSDSSISATGLTTITSIGGGGGGGMLSGGRTGGSGGGRGSGGGYYGAAGTANQGFDGGYDPAASQGGGGGGAASVGGFGTSGQGSGLSVDITGSAVTYATGGNGNINGGSPSASTANTGDGGQGSGSSSGGASGASGIVVLRLNTSDYSGTTTGSPTITTDGDYTVLQYTGSGTYVHS